MRSNSRTMYSSVANERSNDVESREYFAGRLSKHPKDWIRHLPVNAPLKTLPIVPFKVPVRNHRIPEQSRFNFDHLIAFLDHNYNARLIHVIDLTQSLKFYRPHLELSPRGIGYTRIACLGGPNYMPNQHAYREFKRVIDVEMRRIRTIQPHSHHRNLIGVHCTHGRNRTGYLICRYLIEVTGLTADEAIEEFQVARGETIERDNVLHALRMIRSANTR
ncbi:hypothetical protein ACOME3_004877 [Neoechinorhynchus agilis]